MLFRYVNSTLWTVKGRISKAFAKGPKTTSWIWNIHAGAHDFDALFQVRKYTLITRKVFSANLGHLSVVFFWLTGLHFSGAYFSNYDISLRHPSNPMGSFGTLVNARVSYFEGIYITSGLFQLWRSEGILTQIGLKSACTASLSFSIICLCAAYFHMHISSSPTDFAFNKKFKSLAVHHLSTFLGLASITFAGHQYHIAVPVNRLLDSGINPVLIPRAQDFLVSNPMKLRILSGQISLSSIGSHHLFVGIVFISTSIQLRTSLFLNTIPISLLWDLGINSFHAQLCINLGILASLSITFANSIGVYPYLALDYPTVLCLFTHHMWIGGFLSIGAITHGGIYMIADYSQSNIFLANILCHRDIITGQLIWVCIGLGFHSFGIYIHNDTLQALGFRDSQKFQDGCLPLKPVYAAWIQSFFNFDIKILNGKLVEPRLELGTADFMVHHIHAFTIHVCLLICIKAVLYSRSSRLVSDKLELGFLYPCDGPGRGGTCQISAADHIFLAVFWMYNSVSVIIFNFFWKYQSDVWALIIADSKIMHIRLGDFSINSTSIKGWLRNFLWSQSAQVIQSYGSSLSAYGLIFLSAHFVWAFSLMFLYSGRGYWEELIESVLWAHHKLKISPHIQPRALSISEGRAVGLSHYLLGGISTTWSFFHARMVALST